METKTAPTCSACHDQGTPEWHCYYCGNRAYHEAHTETVLYAEHSADSAESFATVIREAIERGTVRINGQKVDTRYKALGVVQTWGTGSLSFPVRAKRGSGQNVVYVKPGQPLVVTVEVAA